MIPLKFFFLVIVAGAVYETVALNASDKGVCTVKLSTKEIRRRVFTVKLNKQCGRKKCVGKRAKNEYVTVWKNHTVCCKGWQHNSDLDVCQPVCSTGCDGGTCVAPDVCHCEPPLHLDPAHGNRCIPYECEPPCVGGLCWGDSCQCLPGLHQYNTTHCVQCDDGFTTNANLECVPQCDKECVNSTCVAPNVCKCLDGYANKGSFTCEPVCECVNADCVAPNTCSCRPGFKAVNETFCTPECDNCDNGACIEPQNCVCNEGYVKMDGVCKPVCDPPCVNGVCSIPNVCECNEGYTKNTSSPEVCYRPCVETCKGSCDLDGVCLEGDCLVNRT